MRNLFNLVFSVFVAVTVMLSCDNNEGLTSHESVPVLTTTAAAEITATSVETGGNITSDGGANITERGICWSTNPNPTIEDNATTEGTGIGSFTSIITGLSAGTRYYVRAYAVNTSGVGYGNSITFTTLTVTVNSYVYHIPETTSDGWETESLGNTGLDEEFFINMMNELRGLTNHGIHSILVAKNNKLVFEEYFSGKDLYTPYMAFNRETTHCLCSITKSFTSALTGIAIDQGFIQGVDQKISDYFIDYDSLFTEGKNQISIYNLLTMTSGFDWEENAYPFTDPRNDLGQFNQSPNPIQYILSKNVGSEPGSTFNYNGGAVNLLGELIHRAVSLDIKAFARMNLFEPLGITDYSWFTLANHITYVSGDLHIRPRDMLKFGQLFLDKGIWKDNQIISEEWIRASHQYHVSNFYGYLWWLNSYNVGTRRISMYYAGGWGGQFIFIIEQLKMVVVFTGGNFNTDGDTPVFSRMLNYILPSAFD